MKRRIGIFLDADVAAALRQYAQQHNPKLSFSQAIEKAIRSLLAREAQSPEAKP